MKEALLVIDMLNDFVLEGAPLEVPRAREIIPSIRERIAWARSEGVPIIYVCDAHEPDDNEFSRMGWPPHAIRGTEGAEVVSELAPKRGDHLVCKTTYSGFYKTELDPLLKSLGIEKVVLTGCVTNICILYSAADAVVRGYEVEIPKGCVAEIDASEGRFALEQMEKVLGAKVV